MYCDHILLYVYILLLLLFIFFFYNNLLKIAGRKIGIIYNVESFTSRISCLLTEKVISERQNYIIGINYVYVPFSAENLMIKITGKYYARNQFITYSHNVVRRQVETEYLGKSRSFISSIKIVFSVSISLSFYLYPSLSLSLFLSLFLSLTDLTVVIFDTPRAVRR